MPLFHEDPLSRTPSLVVSGSIAAELDWALAAAWQPEFRRDHSILARVYDQHPKLGERVRSLWGPAGATTCGGSIELMCLAHNSGLLFTLEGKELITNLEDMCSEAPVELRLASELPEDRAELLSRLRQLRESQELRKRYVALVTDLWTALAPDWEINGWPAVRSAVAARNELQRKGASWREVAANIHYAGDELVNDLVSSLAGNGTVAVVPAFFAHLGSLVDLPGTVLIGVRADGSGAQARARTELLARRLKTISEPTRLAILEALRSTPQTVTELAARFSLAQPTVSNHVKLLRESGIVATATDGERRQLVLQPEVLADLLEHLQEIFALPGQQPRG
jgi:DNA-binding transcriptional ArsR family regulator